MTPIACFWVEAVEGGQWRRFDTGEVRNDPYDFGPGAIYSDPARREGTAPRDKFKTYPDGLTVCVNVPNEQTPGEWTPFCCDGPSYGGPQVGYRPCPWTRSGNPRDTTTFTISPSIHFPGYFHGWLIAGKLTGGAG